MAKKIENLTLRAVEHLAGDDHGEYVGDDLFMAMSARKFGKQFLHTGRPYRVDDGRVMRVLSGHAHSIINMEPHNLQTGMLLVVPADSVFEIEEMDDEFDIQTFSYRELPKETLFKECTTFHLNNDDWQFTDEYFRLLWHTVNRHPLSLSSVRALQRRFSPNSTLYVTRKTQKGSVVPSAVRRIFFIALPLSSTSMPLVNMPSPSMPTVSA